MLNEKDLTFHSYRTGTGKLTYLKVVHEPTGLYGESKDEISESKARENAIGELELKVKLWTRR